LPRTRTYDEGGAIVRDSNGLALYGNLYGNLLDYVVIAVLLFFILVIGGVFVLRRRWPNVERPYRTWGYPIVPALYIIVSLAILVVLVLYKTQTTWPGILIVISGIPIYLIWRAVNRPTASAE
jgi:APA family basic amino acid/polyamine antiporter